MAESASEFFEGLTGRLDPAKTAGLTVDYVFQIEGAGTWTVAVDDGRITVSEGGDSGDCTISASEHNFMRIVRGEQNPTTAYMTGKLKIRGDMGAAMKLQNLF
jgi:putative sterol carrier protein